MDNVVGCIVEKDGVVVNDVVRTAPSEFRFELEVEVKDVEVDVEDKVRG